MTAAPPVVRCARPECRAVLGTVTGPGRLRIGGAVIRERTVLVCVRCGRRHTFCPGHYAEDLTKPRVTS